MTNSNLTSALQGSLEILDQTSPLSEATPDSIDELRDRLLDEANEAFASGMPEKLTEEKLIRLVQVYRAQALHWTQAEQTKKPRTKRGTTIAKSFAPGEAIDLDI